MSDLFKDFNPVSAKEWKQKIQADLKGKDYNSLISKTAEGIDIRPFYHPDDGQQSFAVEAAESWKVTSKIYIQNERKTKDQIKTALEKGIEYFWLVVESQESKLEDLLEEIDFGSIPLLLDFSSFSPDEKRLEEVMDLLTRKKINATISFDPIGKLTKSGNWFHSKNRDFSLSQLLQEKFKQPISISGGVYQNAGANAVQQVAYAVAQAAEYLHYFAEENPSALSDLRFNFKMAIGSDYFMGIAKLRALRLLFAQVAKEFNAPEDIKILAFPTKRNKSIYDYNINLLRTTTEAMSAVLGGADQICNAPYDEIYHNPNEFGDRIARNQLLILKHESYFDAVQNPAEGSYYIENLTETIGKKALNVFKMLEKSGGFLKALHNGKIQQKIKESVEQQQRAFDEGKMTLVGVNKFENPENQMKNELERDPFLSKNKRQTILEPVISRRLAEKVEQKRLKEEENK
jgi:methylmalonyl-CoA mutase